MPLQLLERVETRTDLIEKAGDSQRGVRRIALLGNFLPRLCGIATFTTDIHAAFANKYPQISVDVYAMNDRGRSYDYPAAVVGTIDQDDPLAYASAARAIEASGADLLWVQHEYGIFGGAAGDYLLRLLDLVTIPVAVSLHTVLDRPDADQRRVMKALVRRAARLIVMAERGARLLIDEYGAAPAQVSVIPHGVPDRPLVDNAAMKARLGFAGRDIMLTFGLLSPGKGIETMIAALPAIVERCPDALYVVLGATHPNLVAQEGEAYRERLHALAAQMGVADHVRWIDAFVETDELLDYLTAADIYVTPYLNPAQMTSGTLAYAVGLGTPVVSTPYVHAAELLADGHGRLVDFGDSAGFAEAIVGLLGDRAVLAEMRRRTWALGRAMIWPRLADAALAQFGAVLRDRPTRLRPGSPAHASFKSIERLSDATGILQHSIYSVPDRDHGYCVDDNCRALILMHRAVTLPDAVYDRWTPIYASFVQHAWNPDTRRFRNFMGFDRQWLEPQGSEDSSARTLWSLGVTARDARRSSLRRWAGGLFDQVAGHAFELGSPRARAFAMLAAAAMIEAAPDHALARRVLEESGEALIELLGTIRQPGWAWFEPYLAYDNCRLPEALLRAGTALARDDFTACGLDTLAWIVARQTAPSGVFRAVGTQSFGQAFAPPSRFDQQPVEAWATIDACDAAHAATGDPRWLDEARRAYRWFQGDNDLALAMADPATGECYDGLSPGGVNLNSGAESVLAFHLATCAIGTLTQRAGEDKREAFSALG